MTCHCNYPGCAIADRPHFCTVCTRPHYTAIEALDCCDLDVATDGLMSEIHQDHRQALALKELRGRGEIQRCWSCDRELRASARKPNPAAITVGHYIDIDLGLTPHPFDPSTYGPQCAPCNYAGGAHRTNAKRRGDSGRELTVSPDWT